MQLILPVLLVLPGRNTVYQIFFEYQYKKHCLLYHKGSGAAIQKRMLHRTELYECRFLTLIFQSGLYSKEDAVHGKPDNKDLVSR
jgi:hypothetical protein